MAHDQPAAADDGLTRRNKQVPPHNVSAHNRLPIMSTLTPLDPHVIAQIQDAMRLARLGNLTGARSVAEKALDLGPNRFALHALLGMLCCQAGDLAAGIGYLREAHDAHPADVSVTTNLVQALLQHSQPDEALAVCTQDAAQSDPSYKLWRLRAYLLQLQEDHAAAADAYQKVVAAAPNDMEAWNNLGNSLAQVGDFEGAIAALKRAADHGPDISPTRLNLAAAYLAAGRLDDALNVLTAAVRDFPRDAKLLTELGAVYKQMDREEEAIDALHRAAALDPANVELRIQLGTEQVNNWKMAQAEESFRHVLTLESGNAEAHVLLGVLYEHTNRVDALTELLAAAEQARIDPGAMAFIRALVCRRDKRFDEGLAALAEVPAEIEPIRTAQLAGQFHDRLGNAEQAFAAFEEMNRLMALDPSDPVGRAATYRAHVEHDRQLVTPDWVKSWRPANPSSGRPSPAFLFGFPRSGTTLLDTILLGHPRVQVMEERPVLFRVEEMLGGIDRLPDVGDAEISRLRDRYFEEAAQFVDLGPNTLLIDKSPLHINKVPLIHRLFPDAQIILALRHPCDVVLSCFLTNFRLNGAMANFLDLEGCARLYDLSFGYWEQARALFPLRVHEIRYEGLVAESTTELRPLFEALELDWREEVLNHRETAAGRGVISTASYAQVLEPLYDRAAGRWARYRAQLEPILPIMRPWVERLGYAL